MRGRLLQASRVSTQRNLACFPRVPLSCGGSRHTALLWILGSRLPQAAAALCWSQLELVGIAKLQTWGEGGVFCGHRLHSHCPLARCGSGHRTCQEMTVLCWEETALCGAQLPPGTTHRASLGAWSRLEREHSLEWGRGQKEEEEEEGLTEGRGQPHGGF